MVPEPDFSEYEIAFEILRHYKSTGVKLIPTELIKIGG
jgi:hypothetical protein